MFDQMFEGYRKTSESWLQMQQDMMRQLWQQGLTMPQAANVPGGDWSQGRQKRWLEMIIDLLNKHRESLDSLYRSSIQILEQTFQVTEARSPDDYRRLTEEVWRKVFEVMKNQSDATFRDFRSFAEKSFDMAQNAHP
jgi:hypothetical protein